MLPVNSVCENPLVTNALDEREEKGREVVCTEILPCSTSEADPEMKTRVQVTNYEAAPGRT